MDNGFKTVQKLFMIHARSAITAVHRYQRIIWLYETMYDHMFIKSLSLNTAHKKFHWFQPFLFLCEVSNLSPSRTLIESIEKMSADRIFHNQSMGLLPDLYIYNDPTIRI